MKWTLYLLVCLSALAWTVQGCSDNETPPEQKPDITFPTGSSTQLTFDAEGGTTTLTFTATDVWTAEIDKSGIQTIDWLSVSPTSGQAGTITLTVKADANESQDERNAAIILTCGNVRKTLTAIQKQQDALTVSPHKIELTSEGGNFDIKLQTNVSVTYEIEEDAQSWLSPAADNRSLTTSTLVFHATENTELNLRQGIITLSGGNGLTEQVTVYQAGSAPVLVLTQNEYIVGSEGETIQVELKSNNTYQIEMPPVDWITEADTRALSTYTHYFAIAPNETYDAREATIRFVDEENGLEQTVKIIQMQQDAIIIDPSVYEIGAEGGALDFTVQANVDFTVSTDVDWITQVETRGLTDYSLSFQISPNESEEARTGTITLTDANDNPQNITVEQAGKKNPGTETTVESYEKEEGYWE